MSRPDERCVPAAVRGRAGAAVQVALLLTSVALVAAPPADGAMLIVPLLPTDTARTVRWAIGGGARLVAPGPYAGSIIVTASRAVLLPMALAHGALLATTPSATCGKRKESLS